MKRSTLFLFLWIIFHCKVSQPDNIIIPLDLLGNNCSIHFTEFLFESQPNHLTRSYHPLDPIQSGSTRLQFRIPYGILTRAKPSFSLNRRGKVFVGDLELLSGVDALDLTESRELEIRSDENNCTATISIQAIPITPVVDTGVRFCYDDSAPLPDNPTSCSDPDNALGQDGVWTNVPNPRSWSVSEQVGTNMGIVRDRLTGLVWRQCPRGQASATDCSGSPSLHTFAEAKDFCEVSLNSWDDNNGYAGLKNWRLPTVQELSSLIDYSKNNIDGLLDPGSFPNAAISSADNFGFWTSQNSSDHSAETWRVRFVIGDSVSVVASRNTTGQGCMIRCVSGAIPPEKSWSSDEPELVADENSGLTWEKCLAGQTLSGAECLGNDYDFYPWMDSLKYCQKKGEGWRLPNINELMSLYDYNRPSPGLDSSIFNNQPSSGVAYWTSTTNPQNVAEAFFQEFNGLVEVRSKGAHFLARCVRTSGD